MFTHLGLDAESSTLKYHKNYIHEHKMIYFNNISKTLFSFCNFFHLILSHFFSSLPGPLKKRIILLDIAYIFGGE